MDLFQKWRPENDKPIPARPALFLKMFVWLGYTLCPRQPCIQTLMYFCRFSRKVFSTDIKADKMKLRTELLK